MSRYQSAAKQRFNANTVKMSALVATGGVAALGIAALGLSALFNGPSSEVVYEYDTPARSYYKYAMDHNGCHLNLSFPSNTTEEELKRIHHKFYVQMLENPRATQGFLKDADIVSKLSYVRLKCEVDAALKSPAPAVPNPT